MIPFQCGNVTFWECYLTILDDFPSIQKLCQAECGLPRKSFFYSFSLKSLRGLERKGLDCLPNTSDFWLRDMRLKMTHIKEVPKMSFVDVFGLVGGYLGLFVGVSLTTVIEFLEFALMKLYGFIFQRSNAVVRVQY